VEGSDRAGETGDGSPRPKRRLLRRLGLTAAVIVALTAVTIAAVFVVGPRRALPQIDGVLPVDGLHGEVRVVRDALGVPYVEASDTHDLFFAQGWVHAQERFWQMDVWRHIGAGTLAEMFGADQVETDAFLRTMGWRRLAEAQYAAMPDAERQVLDAYTAGVNAYLATRSPSRLAFEYSLLDLLNRSYDPAPWTPEDSLTWGKVMAWDLGGNLGAEIDRAMLAGVLGPDRVDRLYPSYPETNPVIVPSTDRDVSPAASLRLSPAMTAALERVDGRLGALRALAGRGDPDVGIGSNSWVVSGRLTATGAPILANDPHLGIQIPSIWYQIGLRCRPVSADCPYDVVGFSFAGSPGIVIGHNARIAWGFTNLGPDVQDLYIEKIDPNDPDRYRVGERWVDMEVRVETIDVAGGDPVQIRVRSTRHGPVISDVYGPLSDFDAAGVERPEPYAVALRWTALDDVPSILEPLLGLNRATDWESFRAALERFDAPAQNVVYADVDGHIGYQAPGRIPIRRSGDGTLPVPGWTDRYEWEGFVPYDDLPRLFDPEAGYIVTANNAVVDGGYPYLLTTDWNYGYRARRIDDLLSSNPGLTLRDHGWIQFDTYDLWAEELVPALLAVTSSGFDDTDTEARRILAAWDRHDDADSAGAAIFNVTWRRILANTFQDELPVDRWPIGASRWVTVVSDLLTTPDDAFWDDISTPERENRDAILRRSFLESVDELTDRFGNRPEEWRWGDLHTSTFVNQTLGSTGIGLVDARFNRGAFATSGSKDAVNATGWTATDGYAVDWVPSMRMLVDLGDLDRSLTVHTTGQSGHIASPHYDDMIDRWLRGDYYPMWWAPSSIAADARSTLVLVPGG